MRLFLKCKSGVILSSEQSSFEQVRTELFIAPLWDCLEWSKAERRSVTSCYHGSKFLDLNNRSWQRQPFADCRTMDEKHGLPFRSVSVFMYRKVIHVDFFVFPSTFACRNIVCWDAEILLPWQRDVKTSLLYADLYASTLCFLNQTEEQKQ